MQALRSNIVADDVTVEPQDAGPMQLWLGPLGVAAARELPSQRRLELAIYGLCGAVSWGPESSSLEPVEDCTLETLRVLSGLPRWGVEAGEGRLINETPLVRTALSFHKGCFLGQETVVKVASHRGPARAAMLLQAAGTVRGMEPLLGRDLEVAGRRAGRVLSCANWDGSSWLWVELARDHRAPGRELECRFADGTAVRGRVEQLPLLVPPAPAEDAARLQRLAAERYAAGEVGLAVRLLETAIDIDPEFPDAYESLAVILGRAGRRGEAIALLESFLGARPESVLGHATLSRLYAEEGMIEEAEAERARAAAAAMGGGSAREQDKVPDGGAGRGAGDRELLYRRVLELDPDDPLANLELGTLYLARGRPAEAADLLGRALGADPGIPAAYLALGRARLELGEAAEAAKVFSEGLGVAVSRGDAAAAASLEEQLRALGSSS